MSDEIEFDSLSNGTWIRGRDYIGHWVLFVVKTIIQQNGSFGLQDIATVDFADLSNGDGTVIIDAQLSDRWIVQKLKNRKTVVGLIGQTEPKKPGYKGAIIFNQPEGLQYEAAKAKAKDLLTGNAKPAPLPETDELEDLLG